MAINRPPAPIREAIARVIGARASEGIALAALGEMHTRMGEAEEARECFEQSLVVLDVVQRSVVFGRVERLGRLFRRAALDSHAVRGLRHVSVSVSAHAGITLLAAVFVHTMLVGAVVRPANAYWLLLPSMAAVAGILLIILPRRRPVAPID